MTITQMCQTAVQHHDAGRLQEAEALYHEILRQQPDQPDVLNRLGVLQFSTGRSAEAVAAFRRVAELKPANAPAHNNLGTALNEIGHCEEAIAAYQRAVALQPDYVQAHYNLGNVLSRRHRFDEAIRAFRKALSLHPDVDTCTNLGFALLATGGADEAIALNRQALAQLGPQEPQLLCNLAFALEWAGQFDEARTHYLSALSLKPDLFAAGVNYAVLLMKMGQPEAAWDVFFQTAELRPLPAGIAPESRWDGSDPAGKTILLHATASFGDTLLLARFVPLLKEKGAKIILQCQSPLVPLLQSLGAEQTIAAGRPPPAFDWHASLWALPRRLGFTLQTLPRTVGYLSAPAEHVQRWSKRIVRDAMINVGLVWAGSGKAFHSYRLDVFAPLAEVGGIRFFSMQTGPESSQTPPPNMPLVDYSAEIRDFADTAALVQHLDLVITVDTSAAHVVGALGKPVWVLIPWRTNFFWLLERTDSPWYPTARLFRQKRVDDWTAPVQEMRDALRELVAQRQDRSAR